MKEVLDGWIGHISNLCLIQDTNLSKLNIQDSQCLVNIIQDSQFDLAWLAWRTKKALSNRKKN